MNHVWHRGLVSDRTERGGQVRLLTAVDEYARECLTIEVGRKFIGRDVIAVLEELFASRGRLTYLRSNKRPQLAAKAVRKWLERFGVRELLIEPLSP